MLLDIHSHLADTEVIGLLSGSYDCNTNIVHIQYAHPCRVIDTDNNHLNVEMEPMSQVEVSEQVAKDGLKIVGW
jgi:hypothetical protein